jgi:hypothetical protein
LGNAIVLDMFVHLARQGYGIRMSAVVSAEKARVKRQGITRAESPVWRSFKLLASTYIPYLLVNEESLEVILSERQARQRLFRMAA